MWIGGWFAQNWFSLLSSVGIIGGLWFTAVSFYSEAKTRRIANLLTMTQNHRELWRDLYQNPQLARVLDSSADVQTHPVTRGEAEFVNMVIQHVSSAYQAMRNDLTIKPEGIRRDLRTFFSLPIPNAVWKELRPLQDKGFAQFVDGSLAKQ